MKDLVKKYTKFANRNFNDNADLDDYNQLRNQQLTAELDFFGGDFTIIEEDGHEFTTQRAVWAIVTESTGAQNYDDDFNDHGADWERLRNPSKNTDVERCHFVFDLENEEEKQQYKNFLFDFFDFNLCV